jgi:signal transduction histidine kinase
VPPDKLASKIAVVQRQTERLAAFVDDLLDVSRIRSGRLDVHPEQVDMALLVREEVERLHPMLQRANCPVLLESPNTLMARADPVRVRQVVDNLLSNAGKYGSGRPVAVRISGDAEHALLAVSDQGIGIAEEDQARIFERFERAVGSQHYGGLGLGLWITKQLVQAMGGEIAVQSQPGQGSTFVVRLPA